MGKTVAVAPKRRGRKRRSRRKRPAWRRYVRLSLLVLALALVARTFVVQGYRVPSRSMEDTLLAGDRLLVEKITYGGRVPLTSWRLPAVGAPAPGDVLVFESPEDRNLVYIKRCVAGPGQQVEVRSKVVYVDGHRIIDPPFSKYVDPRILPADLSPRDNFGPAEVPADMVFVIGDNRDNSRDSRHWGFVPVSHLVGRAVLVYWSSEPEYRDGAAVGGSENGWRSQLGRIRWERLGTWVR